MRPVNPHIFYTDDDEDDQDLFRGVLAEIDDSLILTTADDGEELLQLLETPPPVPRLIFLDLNMPRRNGYDVLRTMRSQEHMKDYPVVIFSTTSDAEAVSKTRDLGANLYITKPRTYGGMKQAIRTVLDMPWSQTPIKPDKFLMQFQ